MKPNSRAASEAVRLFAFEGTLAQFLSGSFSRNLYLFHFMQVLPVFAGFLDVTLTVSFTMLPQYQQEFVELLDFELPIEYLAYLFTADSTYEFIGAYLVEADELLQFNVDRNATEFYPGYFLIGSDGGGEAFAIQKATGNFVQTPFIGHDEETPDVLGRTWYEFLEHLQTEYL